ncbi:GDP-mannose 4,6-dehydratase [Nocardia sp. NPDC052112]|uniref:dTDP-glucose 4,6-dehydratase n=1 Tax=Nocardia sp. NPDC052112 TaxID=3155646 RepID=UPI003441A874
MKVLVTGGAGFLGVHVVDQLLRCPKVTSVTVLDCCAHTAAPQALSPSYRVTFIRASMLDADLLADLLADCDAVIHLAAETFVDASIADDRPFIEANIETTAQLLRTLRHVGGRRRLIHASTDEVFGEALDEPFTETSPYRPRNPYAATKAAADHLIRSYTATHQIEATICHFGNLYGRWQYPEKLIPVTVARLRHGEPAQIYGNGHQSRTWLHVTDAAAATIAALEHGRAGESYLVAGDDERTSSAIVATITELMNIERAPQFVADRPGHDLRYVIDTSKARTELGWSPKVPFDTGLADTVQWLTEHDGWWQQ